MAFIGLPCPTYTTGIVPPVSGNAAFNSSSVQSGVMADLSRLPAGDPLRQKGVPAAVEPRGSLPGACGSLSCAPSQCLPVQNQILIEHLGNGQFVGAPFDAGPALVAILGALHSVAGEIQGRLPLEALQDGLEAQCLGNPHPLLTGQAVTAAVAEPRPQVGPDFLHVGQVSLRERLARPVQRNDL